MKRRSLFEGAAALSAGLHFNTYAQHLNFSTAGDELFFQGEKKRLTLNSYRELCLAFPFRAAEEIIFRPGDSAGYACYQPGDLLHIIPHDRFPGKHFFFLV